MAMTKIRGNTQILEKSIRKEQLADDLNLALTQIAEGAELLKRDGSVALTGDLNAANHKLTNVADGVDAKDAATVGQLTAAIAAIPDPMEYKGVIDASLGVVPSVTDTGDVYVVTVAGTIEGVELQVGAELIANKVKASGATMADFDVANRMDQVITVNGKKGVVELVLEDLAGVSVSTVELNQLDGISGNVQELLDGKLDDSQLVTDDTFVSADDATVASSRAVKVYVDTATNAVNTAVQANKTAIEAAVAQEIADRTASVSALDTRVGALETQVSTDISQAISDEVARATAADTVLSDAIAAEAIRAAAAEVATQTALDAYKTANDAAVAQEILDRVAGDGVVQTALDAYKVANDAAVVAEVANRVAGDAAVQANLDAAITSLQGQISSAPAIVDEERPLGVVDGVNKDFTLAFVPVAGSTKVYVNGIRQRAGADNDYTIVAEAGTGLMKVVHFAEAPMIGDSIVADYRK